MSKPQRLCFRAVEFRASGDGTGDGRTLEGYAAVFNSPTEINSWEGTFTEEVAPGAFDKTLRERTPVLQFDHGRDTRVGTVPIGKIEQIREDSKGLYVQARMYDNPTVEPVRQAIEGGSIDGMSFRFKVNNEVWRDKNGDPVPASELSSLLYRPGDRGPLKRTITEVELYEAGPVVFPAYESTSVGVRSILMGLDDDERSRLIRELANEIKGAARTGTPEEETEAARTGTSGLTSEQRVVELRALDLKGL